MSQPAPQPPCPPAEPRSFDVAIGGGGLAGLTLALQIRQELPQLSVVVIERSARPLPPASHKVGESSVELGSHYLERLGLRDYLIANQIIKFGARYFPGGGHLPLEQRTEIGAEEEPTAPSYTVERGRFEEDLRGMVEQAGCTLLEGARVRDVLLCGGDEPHELQIERGGAMQPLRARWLVDATGRNALLRKKLGLKRGSGHSASAAWFRLSGRVDINQMVADPDSAFRRMPTAEHRWRSTNHFMGPGYWVWVIPLAGRRASIGIVVHEGYHSFSQVRTLERCWAFLEAHEPHLAAFLRAHLDAGHEVLDFLCLQRYSHDISRSWSPDRWAAVGDAGAFLDPLYSPGSDFIAMANTFTVEALREDREGGDLERRCQEINSQYQSIFAGTLAIYRDTGAIYGHAPAMCAKVYWDNFIYWSIQCQMFFQRIYALSGPAMSPFLGVRGRFGAASERMQSLLRTWVMLVPEAPRGGFVGEPGIPSLTQDSHLALTRVMDPDQTLAYLRERLARAEELLAEMALRILLELSPEQGRCLVEKTGLDTWGLRLPPGRLEAESQEGEARRQGLSVVALDLERNLPPLRRHPAALGALPPLFASAAAPAAR